ncbi:MAG: zincin-like metallopeptidase domain-containing protein [Pseudomonadota bacterium]
MIGWSVYDVVTGRIVELLKQGVVPWRQSWRVDLPRNLVTDKPYRGINSLLLACTRFKSPYWLTLKQANTLGGSVRPGERGMPVVFWKEPERGTRHAEDDKMSTARRAPVLRYYAVFNAEQVEGIEIPKPTGETFKPVERAEAIIAAMPSPPKIHHGGQQPSYRPRDDTVCMPDRESFDVGDEYYATLFHELAHATGHRSRLARPGVAEMHAFGSHAYSREELIAEIGCAFLCARSGIAATTLENSAAYIKAWIDRLSNDPRLLVTAAGQAQRAADYILGEGQHDEEQDVRGVASAAGIADGRGDGAVTIAIR